MDINHTKIKTLEIPASITRMNYVNDSDALENVYFEENSKLEYIESFVFAMTPNVVNIDFPSSLKWVGQDALLNTRWLDNQPDGLVYAGNCVYTYKGEMPPNTTIHFKEGTTSVGCRAFYGCDNLVSVTSPETMTKLGRYAFAYCSNLIDLNLPSTLLDLGVKALYDTPWYNSQPNGVVYYGNLAISYKGEIPPNASLEIKEGTQVLGGFIFDEQSNLSSISIPASVKSIEDYAFKECSNLSSVHIPANSQLEYIGGCAFYNCMKLHNIELPDGLKTLNLTFCESGLKSINIPNTVTKIARNTFSRCKLLETVVWSEGCTTIAEQMFDGCSSLSSFTIPNSTKAIKFRAFSDCTSLTNIVIPQSVEAMGSKAFYGCNNLKRVVWEATSCIDQEVAFSECPEIGRAHV